MAIHDKLSTTLAARLLCLAPLMLVATHSNAAIIPGASVTGPADFSGTWGWTFDTTINLEGGIVGVSRGAPFWSITPRATSAAAAAPFDPKDLFVNVQHTHNPHGAGEIPVNPPAPGLDINAGAYSRPAGGNLKRAGIEVLAHPAIPNHIDIYNWKVVLPAVGNANIDVTAKHRIKPNAFAVASWHGKGLGGDLELHKSFGAGVADEQVDLKPQDPNSMSINVGKFATRKVTLTQSSADPNATPPRPAGLPVKDYRWVLRNTIDPSTTLSFIAGQPGSYFQAELAMMNDFFGYVGTEYLVPVLNDIAGIDDLFMAVDLTQWLSFPTSFSPGDTFQFSNGISTSLPGIYAATSPFSFDTNVGYVSNNLWSGTGITVAEINGGNVPEPMTLSLYLASASRTRLQCVGDAQIVSEMALGDIEPRRSPNECLQPTVQSAARFARSPLAVG